MLEIVVAFEKAAGLVFSSLIEHFVILLLIIVTLQEVALNMCGHILTPEILVYQKIPLRMTDRRPGDCSEVYASTEKALKELGWK